MGTKRVGLARVEALMENLKRQVAGFNIETTAAAATTITGDAALARNSVNLMNDATAGAYTLPAAADCSRGDVIIVKYIAAIGNGVAHKFGTSGEFFAAHGVVYDQGANADANQGGAILAANQANGTSHDFLNLDGATNGGGGIGTELRFHFDGTQWAVNGKVEKQGSGIAAAVATFATT